MHARPGDVCLLQYMHENSDFFAPGVAALKHVSYFWRNPKLLNSIQLALSLSGQTFLFESRKLGLLEALVLGKGRCARL